MLDINPQKVMESIRERMKEVAKDFEFMRGKVVEYKGKEYSIIGITGGKSTIKKMEGGFYSVSELVFVLSDSLYLEDITLVPVREILG